MIEDEFVEVDTEEESDPTFFILIQKQKIPTLNHYVWIG